MQRMRPRSNQVLSAIRAGDTVMVKGSMGSRMAPIVKALQRCAKTRRVVRSCKLRPHKVEAMLY